VAWRLDDSARSVTAAAPATVASCCGDFAQVLAPKETWAGALRGGPEDCGMTALRLRDEAVAELSYGSGRVGELCGVDLGEVAPEARSVLRSLYERSHPRG
jgi:hypothetical protein